VSLSQLSAALVYLRDGIAFYEAEPPEPYPGRNQEALGNLRDLLAELTGEV
jgi:hypothetical protein